MDNRTINYVSISVLKVHPRNQEFFDDIYGDEYERFKQSVRNDGILSPLIVTSDMTIISGHQRYRAAKDLGIVTVPVIIREDLSDEDNILKALIAANFGRIKKNKDKLRKAVAEYVQLCGYSPNGDRKTECQNGTRLTLDEIAGQLGTSKRNLQRALSIERNLTDSMKELLDTGVISKTVAADVIASLSESEQEELISQLDITKKHTAKDTERIIADLKESKERQQKELNSAKAEADRLRSENNRLRNQPQKIQTIEVAPDDYEETKERLAGARKDYKELHGEYEKMTQKWQSAEQKLRDMQASTPEQEFNQKLKRETIYFCSGVATFIKENGGYVWIAEHINELPEQERRGYISAVKEVYSWASQMMNNLGITE